MKTFRSILVLLCLGALPAYAQDFIQDWGTYTSPSPDAMAMTKFSGASVNEVTGSVGLTIPLVSVSQGAYSFGVGLGYFSNGIRVNEYASRVGLGWALQAGGSITRIIRGKPDDEPNAYGTYTNYPTEQQVADGVYDTEPDFYVYNLCGRSGKFYIVPGTNEAKIIGGDPLKIEFSFSTGITIYDENGNKFEFNTIESTSVMGYYPSGQPVSLQGSTVTGWFLDKIVLADLTEINFSYGALTFQTYGGMREVLTAKENLGTDACGNSIACNTRVNLPSYYNRIAMTNFHNSVRLTEITFESGKVKFIYQPSTRADILYDYALSHVQLTTPDNSVIKDYELTHTYLSGRLMLQEVKQVYFTSYINKYTFSYYEQPLFPGYGTAYAQDKWGFYNAAPSVTIDGLATLLPPVESSATAAVNGVIVSQSTGAIIFRGANRNTNSAVIHSLLMKKVIFPSGVSDEFLFEENVITARNPLTGNDNVVSSGPGVRVKYITHNDGNGKISYTHYTYEGAFAMAAAIFKDYRFLKSYLVHYQCIPEGYNNNTYVPNCDTYFLTSDTWQRLGGILSPNVHYQIVTSTQCTDINNIQTSGIGKTTNTYSVDQTYQPASTSYFIREFLFGKLLKSEVKNKAGSTVKKIEFTYGNYNIHSLGGKHLKKFIAFNGSTVYQYVDYYLHSGAYVLTQIKEYNYSSDNASFLLTTTDFQYPTNNIAIPSKKITTKADGSKISEMYKRAYDYGITATTSLSAPDNHTLAVQKMLLSHILTPVVERVVVLNEGTASEKVAGASLQTFALSGQILIPYKSYALKTTTPAPLSSFTASAINPYSGAFTFSTNYEQTAQVLYTSPKGTVMSTSQRNQLGTVLLDHQQRFPVFKAENADVNNIAYAGFEQYEYHNPGGTFSTPYNSLSWTLTTNAGCARNIFSTTAFAGKTSLDMAGTDCSPVLILGSALNTGKTYKLTAWGQNVPPYVYNSSGQMINNPKTLDQVGSWNLYEWTITNTSFVKLVGNSLVDEVKLLPVGASGSSVVYDPMIGTTAVSSENNTYSWYEYDAFGRLKTIYDHERNILKRYELEQQVSQY